MKSIDILILLFLIFILACSVDQNGLEESTETNYLANRAPLQPKSYLELPLGAIKPEGWLLEQLRRQKEGLTGNLDEVYPAVVGPRNGWLGGDGDGWERGPYWIDGLLPLAYLLEDEELKNKVEPWIEWTLESQTESGYFGPVPFETEPEPEPGIQKTPRRDWWPKMVMLKVLQQHYSATEDPRVIDLLTNYFRYQLQELPSTPIDFWSLWGNRRAGDNMMIIYWLYNLTGDSFLLELAELIQEQAFPWERVFLNEDCYEEQHDPWHYSRVVKRYPYDDAQLDNLCLKQWGGFHCVNLAQGIKKPVIYYQQSGDENLIHAVKTALRDIGKYHGQPQGMYGGDEPLHGPSPNQGVELCSVVELMYSLEKMMAITGDVGFMDHLEKIAFNALPTQIADDFMSRQYMQSANQIEISRGYRNFYQDVGHDGTDICYGVLTGYPCCTCNMHQGWPKFTQSLWHGTVDNGVAALIYAPSRVRALVSDGVEVEIEEQTDYPFSDTIRFFIHTEDEITFPLHLRIPAWCSQAQLWINDESAEDFETDQIIEVERTWSDGDVATLILPSSLRYHRWYDYSVALEKGPLVYALKMDEERHLAKNDDHYGDYFDVTSESRWNYALIEQHLQDPEKNFQLSFSGVTSYPWNTESAPIRLSAMAVVMPDWKSTDGIPSPPPWSPRRVSREDWHLQEIELIPYGCTTLRLTEFPTIWFTD